MKTVQLPDGSPMPALGLGTWHMGESPRAAAAEEAALRHGLDLGIRLIDTAEMYGEGGAERIVGRAIEGRRDQVFLISKVYPHNASRRGVMAACERSLQRLGTDRIDLYLLHWRGSVPLAETVEAFERLQQDGRILHWGVSNFDQDDMNELLSEKAGAHCSANQVYYSLSQRGVEYELCELLAARSMPLIAYCPIDGGALAIDPLLTQIGRLHGASAAQVAIAWLMMRPGVVPIPKAVRLEHVEAICKAADLRLTQDDLVQIDRRFTPPSGPEPLMIV
jgi:diketogulonate reductase-like aldo/keto reductase